MGVAAVAAGFDPGAIAAQDDRMISAHSYPSGRKLPYYVLDGFGQSASGGRGSGAFRHRRPTSVSTLLATWR